MPNRPRPGRRAEQGVRRRARIRAVLLAAKAAGCSRCGATGPPERLHFHHTGLKRANVGRLATYSRAALEAELALCVLLCADCHTLLHTGGGGAG